MFALGITFLIGCGGGGGEDVPMSAPTYTGASLPAVLDSTSGTQSLDQDILMDIYYFSRYFGGGLRLLSVGGSSTGSSDYLEGGDSGSVTYEGSSSSTWSDKHHNTQTIQSLVFDNFADSSGVFLAYSEGSEGSPLPEFMSVSATPQRVPIGAIYYEDLLAGRGSLYRKTTLKMTSDGIPIEEPDFSSLADVQEVSGLVGSLLSEEANYYSNYNAFYTSEGYPFDGYSAREMQILQSGFTSSTMSGTLDTTLGVWAFEDVISADYARNYYYSYDDIYGEPYSYGYTQALLNFSQSHVWDLSTSTFMSSGTYCAEGDVESYVTGCVDFDAALTWENDAGGEPLFCRGYSNPFECYGQPDQGTLTLQADGATASWAYTPGGTLYTFDAGNGAGVFQTVFPPYLSGD